MKNLVQLAVVKLKSFITREEGVDLVEYGMLKNFIAVVAIASVTKLGTTVSSVFSAIAASI